MIEFCYIIIILLYYDLAKQFQKSFFLHTFSYFFGRFKFVFCCKRIRQFKQKSRWCFDIIPLNNASFFLWQDNANPFFLHLGSLRELFLAIWINFWNISWTYFFFLMYKTVIVTVQIFNFWWIIYSALVKIIYKWYNIWNSGCDSIFSWFNAIVAAYWKHLSSSFLGLLLLFSFLSSPKNQCMNHCV